VLGYSTQPLMLIVKGKMMLYAKCELVNKSQNHDSTPHTKSPLHTISETIEINLL
jgi:hypothetical protein